MARVGVGVGVVVLDADRGRLLLGCRKGAHGAGSWALPGGWLEQGEEFKTCALRELEEETGLCSADLIDDASVVPVVSNNVMDLGVHSVTVFVQITLGSPAAAEKVKVCEPHKCTEWRWCPLNSDMPVPLFPPLASLLGSPHWRNTIVPPYVGICEACI